MSKTKQKTPRQISLTLVGLDGNAYAIMGAFQRQARREGWDQKEIEAVLREARSGDYDHLLSVIMRHCKAETVCGGGDDE